MINVVIPAAQTTPVDPVAALTCLQLFEAVVPTGHVVVVAATPWQLFCRVAKKRGGQITDALWPPLGGKVGETKLFRMGKAVANCGEGAGGAGVAKFEGAGAGREQVSGRVPTVFQLRGQRVVPDGATQPRVLTRHPVGQKRMTMSVVGARLVPGGVPQ